MADPSLLECMEVLNPYLEDVDWCLRDGFGFYRSYPDEIIAEHDDRAATSCIYRHQLMRARKRLAAHSGVNTIEVRGLWVVDFHGRVNLRFKKVNSAGRGQNIATEQQQRMFDAQADIPGLPSQAIRVVAGYKADAALTSIDKILISRPWGRGIMWCVQVVLGTDARRVDITPERIAGTERYDKRDEKAGGGG
jgi:hypothetical protein